ncbi:hypothetical protein [Tenacibaculum piscium]|uniref:hypothetical protein n=1 Tax=Tenacibaculum piscium TaxID=1458515 RepID=UPI001F41C6E7|nr:hypothetical protein [Tenacibaculum piscium]
MTNSEIASLITDHLSQPIFNFSAERLGSEVHYLFHICLDAEFVVFSLSSSDFTISGIKYTLHYTWIQTEGDFLKINCALTVKY